MSAASTGLRFVPDSVDGVEMRMLVAAAGRVLRGEVAARARLLAADADEAFAIGGDGELRWRGAWSAEWWPGEKLLTRRAEPLAGDFLEGEAREKVRRRLQEFLRTEIERRLAPLFAAQALPLGGVGRGLVYQLVDALGCLPATDVRPDLRPGAGGQKGVEPARRQLRHRKRLFRAAAARRDDALSGAPLGGMARPAGAEAAIRPPSCQTDRNRSGVAAPHFMRRSAFVSWTDSPCAPTGWSGSRRRRGASHARAPFRPGPSCGDRRRRTSGAARTVRGAGLSRSHRCRWRNVRCAAAPPSRNERGRRSRGPAGETILSPNSGS